MKPGSAKGPGLQFVRGRTAGSVRVWLRKRPGRAAGWAGYYPVIIAYQACDGVSKPRFLLQVLLPCLLAAMSAGAVR